MARCFSNLSSLTCYLLHRNISAILFGSDCGTFRSHVTFVSSDCYNYVGMTLIFLFIYKFTFAIYFYPMYRFTCACQRGRLFQIFMDSLM